MRKVIQIHTGFMGNIFYRLSKADYTNRTLISKYNSGRLFREEAEGDYKELKYSFKKNDEDKTVYIRGFITESKTFNIKEVKSNNKKKRTSIH